MSVVIPIRRKIKRYTPNKGGKEKGGDALSIYHLVAFFTMVVIDRNFIRAFSPNEQLVMLRLLLEADSEGVVEYNAKRMENGTRLSSEVLSGICHKFLNDGVITVKDKKIVICDFDGYQYQGKKKPKKREITISDEPLEARAKAFYNSLIPYLDTMGGKYPKEMIRLFYNHWSEPNKSRTKMKFELEKTWEVGRRLVTWYNNSKRFNNNNYKSRDEQRIDDVQRRQESAAGIIARLAAEENNDNQQTW